MFKIIARWIKRAKHAGKLSQACMLHAHLAFIYRNVEAEDLNPRVVFSILASQIFLYNYFKYDVDLDMGAAVGKRSKDRKSTLEEREAEKSVQETELIIPHVELFDMFQVRLHRRREGANTRGRRQCAVNFSPPCVSTPLRPPPAEPPEALAMARKVSRRAE